MSALIKVGLIYGSTRRDDFATGSRSGQVR